MGLWLEQLVGVDADVLGNHFRNESIAMVTCGVDPTCPYLAIRSAHCMTQSC